jgi:predicted NBD/HSP70 family sugar kinase
VKRNHYSDSGRYAPASAGRFAHEALIQRVPDTARLGLKVLAIDIGGTSVKILVSGAQEGRKFPSGPEMTPQKMVTGVKDLAAGWQYEAVSIGYPGQVARGHIMTEPHNLSPGWVSFDFAAAFGCPVRIMNDAAMQALGSYHGGIMLFLGLGTGLGSAVIADGVVVPMEIAHLPYKNSTYEDYLGVRGLKRRGKKKWRKHVELAVAQLISAIHADEVVIGGGNAVKLREMPLGCRACHAGDNAWALVGGFRMWEDAQSPQRPEPASAERLRGPRRSKRH